MTILVTGAAGFVGAQVVRGLAQEFREERIVATDLAAADSASWTDSADRVSARALDVTDRAAVHALVAAVAPKFIVHAAALTPSPEQEREAPTRIVDVNLGGTVNILDAALGTHGCARVVCFSSAGVYGLGRSGPLAETDALQPGNLYAATKAAGELLVERYAGLSGRSMVAVRVASVYGPGERASATRPRPSPIARLADAHAARRAIRVAGGDVTRDWVHGADVAGAIGALLRADRLSHRIYNIASGQATGWHAILSAFCRRGLAVTAVDDAAEADMAMTAADARPVLAIDRLAADTGFRPRLDLDAGLDLILKPRLVEAAR